MRHGRASDFTQIGEVTAGATGRDTLPLPARIRRLEIWLREIRLTVPDVEVLTAMAPCDSGAEARLLWEFVVMGFAQLDGATFVDGRTRVRPQVPCRGYWIDLVAELGHVKLAIEVDGMEFHHRKPEQVAHDYLRDRRLTLSGYRVVRFTAQEVFLNAGECWRQIDAILSALEKPEVAD